MMNWKLDYLRESTDLEVDDIVDIIIKKLSMLDDITFSNKKETDDYVLITVNSEKPDKAKRQLSSFKFSHAINAMIEPMRKTIENGYKLAVYDEDGDPFDKDIFIRIRRGGIYNAGVSNEVNLVNILQSSLEDGIDTFVFSGYDNSVVLRDVNSVRQCGADPGSRMGNRADIEIITDDETTCKFSLKKDNAYKVAGLIRKFAPQSYKIGKAIRTHFLKNHIPITKRYLSVKITNPELYKWCWFGNDIDENGAVLIGNIDNNKVKMGDDDSTIVDFSYVLKPTDSILSMINEYPIYFFMSMNRHGGIKIKAAVRKKFGERYEVGGLVIPGVNDEPLTESNSEGTNQSSVPDIFHGYHIYTDYDPVEEAYTTQIKIDYGIRGTSSIVVTSYDESEIHFKDLKWNEDSKTYGPETSGDEHVSKIEEIESGKWVRGPGLGMVKV